MEADEEQCGSRGRKRTSPRHPKHVLPSTSDDTRMASSSAAKARCKRGSDEDVKGRRRSLQCHLADGGGGDDDDDDAVVDDDEPRGDAGPAPVIHHCQAQPPSIVASAANSVSIPLAKEKQIPHPPPPSPASPVVPIPSSVILPPQPNPTPSDAKFVVHSTTRRPASPPYQSRHRQSAAVPVAAVAPPVPVAPAVTMSNHHQARTKVSTLDAASNNAYRIRADEPDHTHAAAVATAAASNKRANKMFFLSSPTTDSEDETLSSPYPAKKGAKNGVKKPDIDKELASSISPKGPPPCTNMVGKQAAAAAAAPKLQRANQVHIPHRDEEFEDEDDYDDSDWSSETTDTEEDERAAAEAAAKAEEERQRQMFAKRPPSQVNVASGLLSQMLRPEDFPRNFANLPPHLRGNRSAVELARARHAKTIQGIERAIPGNRDHLSVTGLNSSKSAAALPNLVGFGNGSRSRLGTGHVNTRSGNGLTRLGGMPSGIELSSDEDDTDDEEGTGSSGQDSGKSRGSSNHERLVTLMDKKARPGATDHPVPVASIAPPVISPGAAFTPRTTRRNMLATELTESLRMNLIWERQTRARGAIAGLGGMVAAVGNRLTGRQGSQPSLDELVRRPQVQRGNNNFQENKQQMEEQPQPLPYILPARPPPPPRTSSDQPTASYYSPGFHHVGW